MNKAEIMTKKHDKKCPQVPRLRFPEFQNAGKWKWNKLKEVCEINPSSGALPQTFVYIDLESVSSGKLLSKKTMLLEDAPSRAQRLVKNGDILFQMVRPYQKNNLYCNFNDTRNYVASTGYAILRASENSKFLYQAIHCDDFVDRVISKCTGSNYPAINSSHLSELVISTPILQEQQRIADCLSSLDERIAAETSKLDRLKDHKKGLLKQLFPAEGETLPQLRFPDFRDAGEWVQKIISDVCSISTGKSNTQDKNDDGIFPFYVRSAIIERSTKYLYDEEAILTVGDGVGTGKIYHYVNGKYDLHQRVYRLFKFQNIDGKFLFYLFSTFFYDRVSKMSAKNSVDSVRMDMIAKMPISLPTLPEEQRIADCLSSLDELIASQTQKIDLLKEHKKGLMQQLFPCIDEVRA